MTRWQSAVAFTAADPASMRRALLRATLAADDHRRALGKVVGLALAEMFAVERLAHDGELTPSQLAARVGLTSGGVAVLVQRLERQGLLERRPHPDDRRSVHVRLTPEIRTRVADVLAPLVQEIDALTASLPSAERLVVRRYLDGVADTRERRAEELRRLAAPKRASGPPLIDPPLWA